MHIGLQRLEDLDLGLSFSDVMCFDRFVFWLWGWWKGQYSLRWEKLLETFYVIVVGMLVLEGRSMKRLVGCGQLYMMHTD